jgi:hypothetical protein
MHEIRDSIRTDVAYLAPRLREDDVNELRACGWDDPVAALDLSLDLSASAWTVLDNAGNPCMMFGVGHSPDEEPTTGIPWMLATNYINTVPTEFLRRSRKYIRQMHAKFPLLTQVVDARNAASVHWMLWLGFACLRVIPRHGPERRPFIHFIKEI